jgi:cell division initiation protein
MIDLTPLEVRQKKGDFRRALRGYEPELVNDFLDLVADRMEELVRENMALRDAAGSVQDELTAYRHKEQALSEALMAAQKLREDARDHAEREGDLLLREARLAAETLRHEAARQAVREEEALRQIRARRIQLVESFRRLLERELGELDVIQETLDLRPSPAETPAGELDPGPAITARRTAGPPAPAARFSATAGAGAAAAASAPSPAAAPAAEAAEVAERDAFDDAGFDEVAAPDARGEESLPVHAADEPLGEQPADEPAAVEQVEKSLEEEAPLNLEWPGQEVAAPEPPRPKKRVKPEGFDAADAADEGQDDWLSSLMEEE